VKKIKLSKSRYVARHRKKEPSVGIFWVFGGKLVIDSVPLGEAEPYGVHLTHPGINKTAANLSAGSLERTRLRCSSMSSWIVAIFPLTVYTGDVRIVWKIGVSYRRFLAGCVLWRVEVREFDVRQACVCCAMAKGVPYERSQTCEPCRASPAAHRA
jgi:hypothetical protein